MPDMRRVSVTVNGKSYSREVESRLTLVDFIRHELNLTGTHVGCEHGVCGACTVLLDGAAVRACLLLAVQANGKQHRYRRGARRRRQAQPVAGSLSRQSWPCSADSARRACS